MIKWLIKAIQLNSSVFLVRLKNYKKTQVQLYKSQGKGFFGAKSD